MPKIILEHIKKKRKNNDIIYYIDVFIFLYEIV